MAEEEEAKDLDPPSNDDLLSCSPEWDSDEEAVRLDILLLQANWAKPTRKRKALTAREKRKRFAMMIRRCRPTPQDEHRSSPHALDDVGAPNAEHERLDLSRASLGHDAVCPGLPHARSY